MVWMCFWISIGMFLLWSSSCSIPRVSANPGVSRMRTLRRGYTCSLRQCTGTYYWAVGARGLVKAGRFGPTLVARTILLVATVEVPKVVAINSVACKDIGEEFHECGFPDTSLSNQKDSVLRLNIVLRCRDDPSLERLYVTRNYG